MTNILKMDFVLLILLFINCVLCFKSSCDWEPLENKDGASIVCQLRTLQYLDDAIARANLSAYKSYQTTSIDIECNQVLLFESVLTGDGFHRLPRLEEISIKGCKVKDIQPNALSNLQYLRALRIDSEGENYLTLALKLQLHSFRGLLQLRELELVDTGLSDSSNNQFCELTTLKKLNLTKNRLSDVNTLRMDCLRELTSLDLSRNRIDSLRSRSFVNIAQLKSLDVSENLINHLEDGAFDGLLSLRTLNLSSNNITSLPNKVFRDLMDLSALDLSENSIQFIASDTFSGLTNLQTLNLSLNNLSELDEDLFNGLMRLVMLDLHTNKIETLGADVFQDLSSLQSLDLSSNKLSSLSDTTFSRLPNLHTLNLRHNYLTAINSAIFQSLFSLAFLSLNDNRIEDMSGHAFQNCSSLQDLHMSGNQLLKVPEAISNIPMLRNLDLSSNEIFALEGLPRLPTLVGLNLDNNLIATIRRSTFESFENLIGLSLSSNKISYVEPGAFERSSRLQVLRLDNNNISDINGILSGLVNLQWLNLSTNAISVFDYSFIPPQLEWLDIHGNFIDELGNYFMLESQIKLKAVDASENKITGVTAENIPDSIVFLHLSNNSISSVAPNSFLRKSNLTVIELENNLLTKLDPSSLWLSGIPEDRELPRVRLGGNPFVCDCTMEWLQRIIQPPASSRLQPILGDPADVYCSVVNSEIPRPLAEIRSDEFLCPYQSHCFALCHCCDFDACDCEMACPAGCSCYHDATWSSNIVDCSSSNMELLPGNLPMDVTHVRLDGNTIAELKSHSFIGRKNLKELYLNSSSIEIIRNRTFHGLNMLEELHLQNNLLTELNGLEFGLLQSLKVVNLQNNKLRVVDSATFSQLPVLTTLRLENNYLARFPQEFGQNLISLTLGHNQITCDCEFLPSLYTWLEENRNVIQDRSAVRCQSDMQLKDILEATTECGHAVAKTIVRTEVAAEERDMSIVFVWAVLSLCLLVVIGFLVLRRRAIRNWIKKCSYNDDSTRSLFDVCVVHSLKDSTFALQALSPELETGALQLRMHFQYRDGGGSPEEAVSVATMTSRRVLVIASKAFLATEWQRPEIRKCISASASLRPVILLVVEKDIEHELRSEIGNVIIVRWGEHKFWQTLKRYLPAPSVNEHKWKNTDPVYAHSVHRYTSTPMKYATSERSDHTYTSVDISSDIDHIYTTLDPCTVVHTYCTQCTLERYRPITLTDAHQNNLFSNYGESKTYHV